MMLVGGTELSNAAVMTTSVRLIWFWSSILAVTHDADDLVFEDDAVFTINASLDDDDESEEETDDSVEYTLEEPRFEDGLLKDYEETVIEANIQHNKNFDGHSNKKETNKLKRQIQSEEGYTWRYATVNQPEIVYDYEQFKDEYDHQVEEMKKSQGSLNETEFKSQPKSECEADKFYNKGPFTAICLLNEYHGDDENLRANALSELTFIAYFWAILLFLFIVVGWAHLGYCNLFCPCSFCFPEDGYEDIKRYLVLNPPGVLVREITRKSSLESKTIIKKEIYRPTETEHYLYNKLWRAVYNV